MGSHFYRNVLSLLYEYLQYDAGVAIIMEEDVYPFNSWRCRHEPNSSFETQSKLVSLKQISATFFKLILNVSMHMVFLRCVPILCVYVSEDINLSWTRDLECRRLAKWRCQEDSTYKKVAHELAIHFQLSRMVNVLFTWYFQSACIERIIDKSDSVGAESIYNRSERS